MHRHFRASIVAMALLATTVGLPVLAQTPTDAATPIASPTTSPVTFADLGLAQPESVLFDPVADVYLVSNLNGSPAAEDDNGFVSIVRPDGTLVAERWIDGASEEITLNAPKGMAIVGDTLYVADITLVRMFDRNTGEPTGEIAVPGAAFLNDIAASPTGLIYVSDSGFTINDAGEQESTGTDAVHVIQDGVATPLVTAPEVTAPNGLAVAENGDITVVTMTDPGQVITVTPDGTIRSTTHLPAAFLDGVVWLADGSLAVTSWGAGSVVVLHPAGDPVTLASDIPSPADLGYDSSRRLLVVPDMQNNQLVIIPAR